VPRKGRMRRPCDVGSVLYLGWNDITALVVMKILLELCKMLPLRETGKEGT
jgi:hypothetical protein